MDPDNGAVCRERKASFLQQARDEAQRLAEEKSALLTKQLGEERRLADEELAEARAETERRRREIEEAEVKAMHDALQIEDSMKRLQEEQLRAELEVGESGCHCRVTSADITGCSASGRVSLHGSVRRRRTTRLPRRSRSCSRCRSGYRPRVHPRCSSRTSGRSRSSRYVGGAVEARHGWITAACVYSTSCGWSTTSIRLRSACSSNVGLSGVALGTTLRLLACFPLP